VPSVQNRDHSRALEPIARRLFTYLTVPEIYFDAGWPTERDERVDVIAIDRAGSGDPHLVEVKVTWDDVMGAIPALMARPASYKWVAYFGETASPATKAALADNSILFPAEGSGRVGVISIVRMAGDELGANVQIKAERFPSTYYPEVDAFVQNHRPAFRI